MSSHFPEIKRILSIKELPAKIICVLLSVTLWYYISSTNQGELKFKIPVAFTDISNALTMSKISSRYVTITLAGRKDILKNVNIKEIKAIVNLEHGEIGVVKNYPIEVIRDEVPENVDLRLSDKEISLLLERKISKKVAIHADIVDKAKTGFVIGKIKIEPDAVTVTGAESALRKIDFLETEKLSIANITGRLIREVPIDLKDITDVTTDVNRVKVIIPLIETDKLSEFIKPVSLKNIDDRFNYVLNKNEVSVYMQADNPRIKISPDDVDVYIDMASIDLQGLLKNGGSNYIEKDFIVNGTVKRDGIRLISMSPDIVTIKISGK